MSGATSRNGRLLVLPIRAYQRVISPFLGQRCRFYPSCSAYAVVAIETHGPVRGLWFAVRRVARCHPWNPGGVDPVPPAKSTGSAGSTAVQQPSSVIKPGAIRCHTS